MPGQDAVCRAVEDVPVVWGEQPQPCAALLGVYMGVLLFAEMGLPKLVLDVTKNPQRGPGEAAMDTDGHRQTLMVTDGHQWTQVDTGGRWGTRPLFCLILARQCRGRSGLCWAAGAAAGAPGGGRRHSEPALCRSGPACRGSCQRLRGASWSRAPCHQMCRSVSPNMLFSVTKHAAPCHQTCRSVSPAHGGHRHLSARGSRLCSSVHVT